MPTIKRLKSTTINKDTNKELAQRYVYNTERWKRLRRYKLQNNPLCERCLELNKIEPAVQVHHMVRFMSGSNIEQIKYLGFDYSNLQSICKECHEKIHKNKV